MNVKTQKFQSQWGCMVNHWPRATIGRHSLSHARWACQLPQRGSREAFPCNGVLAKIQRCGRFSSPLRKLRMLYTLTCNVPPGNCSVAGDFHRPYESSECFTLYHAMYRPETATLPGATKKMFTDTVGLWYDMAKGTETEGSSNEFYCPGYGMESALARLAVV